MMDIRKTFELANVAWNEAFNAKDTAKLATFYHEQAILSPGNGQILKGQAEIEALFRSFIDAGVHRHTLEIVEVGGSGNTIYQIANWAANTADNTTSTSSFGGVTTSVFEQTTHGDWVAVSHIWNTRS